MAIRLSGLASGLDTDSIVQALVAAKAAKKTKVEAKKTKLEWTQSIWSTLNTKLYNFYKDYVGKVRFQSSYLTKKATVSDASKVTVTASSSAVNGSHTLKVMNLAKAQMVTSAQVGKYTTTVEDEDGNKSQVTSAVSGSTKLSELNAFTASDGSNVSFADGNKQIQISVGQGDDAKTVSFNVDQDTTVNDFLTQLQSAGLNASFDTTQQRFFISSKESGKENSFSITSATLDGTQVAARDTLKASVDYDNLSSAQKTQVQSVMSNLQNSDSADKITEAETTLMGIADARAESVITNYYTEQYKNKLTQDYLGADGETLTAAGRKALEDANLDNDTYVDEDRVEVLKKLISTQTSEYISSDEMKGQIADDVINGLSAAGVDSKADRDYAITQAVSAYERAVTDASGKSAVNSDDDDKSALQLLGLGNITGGAVTETESNGMVVVAAADSEIQLDGVTLTGSSTTMTVNGLTLDLIGKTGDSEITFSVENDTSAVYDMIKEYINQYNSILAEFNTRYYASSASDYDVLTEDEKADMSESEIEKWETKIKDSLLRRDDTLNSLIQTLRNSMTNTVITASNGKSYSLANLGITTGTDYKEYGLLHIKGDEDDTEYADSANTLLNLLTEDPDVVTEVLSGITSKLYTDLQKKMASTTMSSALTFYNDKEMNSQLSRYKDEISTWETKLAALEERYYSQFTAMEKAMSNLNSQQNIFAQYLGS